MPSPKSLLAVACGLLFCAVTVAQDCCQDCGCQQSVQRVCRLKCETKKVPKTAYSYVCEDFCVADPSEKCGYTCVVDENGCERQVEHRVPTSARVYTRRKFVKTVTEKEEPSYKWVVECVCDQCLAKAAEADRAQPVADGKRPTASSNVQRASHTEVKPAPTPAASPLPRRRMPSVKSLFKK